MNMPYDDNILLSLTNMKLRDGYDSPESLCDDLGWDLETLGARLSALGYRYDEAQNRYSAISTARSGKVDKSVDNS